MAKVIGFHAYERIAFSNMNPRAVKKLTLNPRRTLLIGPIEVPPTPCFLTAVALEHLSVTVVRTYVTDGPDGKSIPIGTYDGNEWTWDCQYRDHHDPAEAMAFGISTRNVVRKSGCGHPDEIFLAVFLQECEDVWPVANVMLR